MNLFIKKVSWYAAYIEAQYISGELSGTDNTHAMSSIIPQFWLGLWLYVPGNSYGHVGTSVHLTTLFPGQA